MITERQLQSIQDRWNRPEYSYPNDPAKKDVDALCAELERLADLLSDCWLALDMIAQDAPRLGAELRKQLLFSEANEATSFGHVAARVLRLQQAPGWKTTEEKPNA